MSIVERTAAGSTQEVAPDWNILGENSNLYRCCVYLLSEDDGFSAHCPQLPGAVSQGDTKQEAFANIREALEGVIESYSADGEEIPWVNEFEIPDDKVAVRWISLNV